MKRLNRITCITTFAAIVCAALVPASPALAGDPVPPYFRVQHNLTSDITSPITYPDPPSGTMTSVDPILGFASSDTLNPGGTGNPSNNSQAVLTASGGELSTDVDLFHHSFGGVNAGANAYGFAEWVANDLVFTSTIGQTGTVVVQLRGELCVSHGGSCASCPGSCDPCPCTCPPGEATRLSADRVHFICCPPDFMKFVFKSPSTGGSGIPQGCIDVTGSPQTVELGQTITWGLNMIGYLNAGSGLNGGEQTNTAFLNATLRFGDLQPDGSIGPAFILPEGVTVNAPSVGLVDNFFLSPFVPTCGCPSDLNDDGQRDGLDIRGFMQCLLATGTNCDCADVDGTAGLDTGDVAAFVDDLIIGAACP